MSADPIIYCLEHLTDYPQFERLCSDIMNQSGYRDIEPLGGSNDRGRDALHVSRADPADITIFAYSVRADWEQKLLNEDCKRIQAEHHKLETLVFATTANITSSQRDAAKAAVRQRFGWTLDLFDIKRLRIRLVGDLRHLIAQHSAIFCEPFFPKRGGLSIAESRDIIVIDHSFQNHALATWLARRLQLIGYRTWCYGTAPLAGETADQTVRALIANRAIRYVPILSRESIVDADFVARCASAVDVDGLMLPCRADDYCDATLPKRIRDLTPAEFSKSWAVGLKSMTAALGGIRPSMNSAQGTAIALRSYVPEPVTKNSSETVYSNVFAVTCPEGVLACDLSRELTEAEEVSLRTEWPFVRAHSKLLLSFTEPPSSVPRADRQRLPEYAWKCYDEKFGKRSIDVVKELVRRSMDVACLNAGLHRCEHRDVLYFPPLDKPLRNVSFTHVDGRATRVAVTGLHSYGRGEKAEPFRYQLSPDFRVGFDEAGRCWVTLKVYVRVTDDKGVPFEGKAIGRRRKKVAKSWWNKEWFARVLGVMQGISEGKADIVVGNEHRRVSVSCTPLRWECPVAIDYHAVERVGDFQEEMANLRFTDEEEDQNDEASEDDEL